MEYSIQEVAKAAGVSSRTLRHYGTVGILPPSRIGGNGYRQYDDRSLVRLQRILVLRELGLGLDTIAQVLAAQDAEQASQEASEASILETHLELLHQERARIHRQIGAVERTIAALNNKADRAMIRPMKGIGLMNENIFDGFDHTQYRDEVEARWGSAAYAQSDKWWRALSTQSQEEWMEQVKRLNSDWADAAKRGVDPASEAAQALAAKHLAWLHSVPGVPEGDAFEGYVLGLGEMYVTDERFAANYGGVAGATLVRDALRVSLGQ